MCAQSGSPCFIVLARHCQKSNHALVLVQQQCWQSAAAWPSPTPRCISMARGAAHLRSQSNSCTLTLSLVLAAPRECSPRSPERWPAVPRPPRRMVMAARPCRCTARSIWLALIGIGSPTWFTSAFLLLFIGPVAVVLGGRPSFAPTNFYFAVHRLGVCVQWCVCSKHWCRWTVRRRARVVTRSTVKLGGT